MFWPLVFGYGLSAIVLVLVSRRILARLLADVAPSNLTPATLVGLGSRSNVYAAGTLARSLFRTAARVTAAMVLH